MTKGIYNKKIFALLLERAKGERSWRQFADDCGISYVQLRKLSMCGQENPPRLKFIAKLASASVEITEEEYRFAAGYREDEVRDVLADAIDALSTEKRRIVTELVELLSKQQ